MSIDFSYIFVSLEEIVQTAAPILDKLDRYGFFINHRLFREATRSINGQIVKVCNFEVAVFTQANAK